MNALSGPISPRLRELRESVTRHERQIADWQPMVDIYQGQCDTAQQATTLARKGLRKDLLWVGAGVAGMALGMLVPGTQFAAIVGFGCFFKGWRDSFGNLQAARVYKNEARFWGEKVANCKKSQDEIRVLLASARTALMNGEAEEEVRALNEGMKRTSAIFETPREVQVGGVRIKKR